MNRILRHCALPLAAAAILSAHAQSHDVVTLIKTTVTTPDQAYAMQAGKDFAAQGLPTSITTTTGSDAGTTWTVTATRTGAITPAQVDAATAWCQRVRTKITYGAPSTCTTTVVHSTP